MGATLYGLTDKDRGALRETMRRVNGLPGMSPAASRHRTYGGSEDAGYEYNGYFKVVSSGENLVKVVNGADPESPVCGLCTLATNISCNATELPVSGAGAIYIRFFYTTAWQYQFMFSATFPAVAQEIYVPLASISVDGTPGQQWTGGAITYLNGSYVL